MQTRGAPKDPLFRAAGLLLTGLLMTLFLSSPLTAAREDSATLTLQKTAGQQKTGTRLYIVKRGDRIDRIMRIHLGYESVPHSLIRRMNPELRNLNRIYPGQKILLPLREIAETTEPAKPIPPDGKPSITEYLIQDGDSISRILLTELNVNPADVMSTYRLLRQMNPDIEDMSSLSAGQRLKLPAAPDRKDRPAAAPVQTADSRTDTPLPSATLPAPAVDGQKDAPPSPTAPPPAADSQKEPPPITVAAGTTPATEEMLRIIRPVIVRMKGSLTAKGHYYIPLRDSTQITIDCSLIPVVELDDGSTVFLDFTNRLPDPFKAMIGQSSPHFAFLSAQELSDDLASLQGIIRHSRNYTMFNAARPLKLSQKPEILVSPDWIIEARRAAGGALYRQGLFFLGSSEKPLPMGARRFMEQNGLIATEISDGRVIAAPKEQTAPTAIPDLRGLRGIALAEQLLKMAGETPVRNAEIVLFEQARHGFNLSITVDLLLRRAEKRFVIHSKKLPDQFLRILKEEGTESILIGERDSGRPLIESVLQGLQIPVSFGHFSRRIPEDGPRRLAASFSALQVKTDREPLYLIDYDISPDALSVLLGRPGGRFVNY